MKLIIQIPCFNEENTLPLTLREIPKQIPGVDSVEILIINDGSTDKTVEIAQKEGIKHIVNLPQRSGLARAFSRGIEEALKLGGDIIVNTDGDNQYKGSDIPRLILPIIEKKADIVIGCRDIFTIKHFSLAKKILQKIGSSMVNHFSNTSIPDATSGFRAYSRTAAIKLNVFSAYTYTLETIIQAGRKGIPMSYVQIGTNKKLRESRLMKSTFSYILRSIATVLRIYLMYEPMKFFVRIGFLFLGGSILIGLRYLMIILSGASHSGHIQSLILAVIFTIIGIQLIFIGFLADIIAANRRLSEEILCRLKEKQFKPQ